MPAETTVPVCEVFTSAQGEGLLVGVRQIFIRLRGCNLTCVYCDTPQARSAAGSCRVEQESGSGRFTECESPMSVAQLLAIVRGLASADRHAQHSVALTGGEPLLHWHAVGLLASRLRYYGYRIYLETAGHLPQALAEVIQELDWVAMDWKLPSTLSKPVPGARFAEFLDIARQRHCFIKLVVTDRTPEEELREACRVISEVTRTVPLVLQPVSPVGSAVRPPDPATLLRWQSLATTFVDDVRIIPQCHKLAGLA